MLKNIKIKYKLVLAFLLVAVLTSSAGIICFTVAHRLNSRFEESIIITVCALLGISIFISLLLGIKIAESIAAPIESCAFRLQLLSKGDLKTPVPGSKANDETGLLSQTTENLVNSLTLIVNDIGYLLTEMSNGNFDIKSKATDLYVGDFSDLIKSLRGINWRLSDALAQIAISAEEVSAGSEQVAGGSQALAQGSTQQASSIQELAAAINDISAQVRENANTSKNVSALAEEVGQEMSKSNEKMQDMLKSIGEISHRADEIKLISKTIEDIAFQTNILALNAAVEAARAGQAGKGFAVVANEVRNLASKSAEASKNTSSLIQDSILSVQRGAKIADETAVSLNKVIEDAKKVTAFIENISRASDSQAESIVQISQGIDQISAVIQSNSASSEESAAASEELSGQARILKELVGNFRFRQKGK